MDFYLYKIYIRVRDSQGRSCLQPYIIPLQACRCDSRNYCSSGATKIIIIGGGDGGGGPDDDRIGWTGRPVTEDYTDVTYWNTNTEIYESYTAEDGNGYPLTYGPSSTTLSGAAIGLMFLGGLIFVRKY